MSLVDDVAVVEDFRHFSLAKTISSVERKLDDGDGQENDVDDIMSSAGDEIGSGELYNVRKITHYSLCYCGVQSACTRQWPHTAKITISPNW